MPPRSWAVWSRMGWRGRSTSSAPNTRPWLSRSGSKAWSAPVRRCELRSSSVGLAKVTLWPRSTCPSWFLTLGELSHAAPPPSSE
jgi:hypothetical protein